MYREGPDSIVTDNGKNYRVDDLLRVGEKKPTQMLDIKKLVWVLKYIDLDRGRVAKADVSVPLLVLLREDGTYIVLDGAHRLTKAANERLKQVPVKLLDEADVKHLALPVSHRW